MFLLSLLKFFIQDVVPAESVAEHSTKDKKKKHEKKKASKKVA